MEPRSDLESVHFIDDDPAFLGGMRRALKPFQTTWQMQFHPDAMLALPNILARSDCVIVLDWEMPSISGPAFCETVRNELEKNDCDLPPHIIVLSGRTDTNSLIEALDRGADDYLSKPVDSRELAARIRAGQRLLAERRENHRLKEELRAVAVTDHLTGLMNRREAYRILELELARVSRSLQSLAVILIDLDHFKGINDRHGHQAGDEALVFAANSFRASARVYDSCARWGGEEFLVICPDKLDSDPQAIAERLRMSLAERSLVLAGGTEIPITASLGVGAVPSGLQASPDDVLEIADECLYEAKRHGRNASVVRRLSSASPGLRHRSGADAAAGH